MANGNINDGIAIKSASGLTENSNARTRNNTKIMFPVSGPNAKSTNIITSTNFEVFFGSIFDSQIQFLTVYYKKKGFYIKLSVIKK